MKVVVLGGGVGGLSAAQELVERGFQVEVYEKKTIWGGKARSMPDPGTGTGGRQDLPGEHGFRFFPGFYKHLPDTMKRIPAPTASSPSHTAFQNLVGTTQIEMAQEKNPPIVTPSRFPRDYAEWKEAFVELHRDKVGIPDIELFVFAERLFQILTSCQERRLAEYETIQWWKFIDAASKSTLYQKILGEGLTRSLVAMKATKASTRTVGDILIQLILNTLTPDANSDRVLNAPTNDAWIDPWTTYLGNAGVKLVNNASILNINCTGTSITSVDIEIGGVKQTITGDYYVAAMPCEVMTRFVTPAMTVAAPTLAGIGKLNTEWMNGIQFYLATDVPIDNGHTIYLDSEWALTTISQHQFWPGVDLSKYGAGNVKGVLSVDISDWTTPGVKTTTKPANQCTEQEIAAEVWAQLKAHVNRPGMVLLNDSNMIGFHLDPDIQFPRASSANDTNAEPLLVNVIDSWQYRPEATVGITNLFLASDYVRTYTDLATMEGANEAARRATNGILKASGSSATPCQLWPLVEPEIFDAAKKNDLARFRKGLPWTIFSSF